MALDPFDADEPVEVPLTDELDLHTFRPSEVSSLVPEYLAEARRRGWRTVRIIHGKGTGTLRETVHALLRRDPGVEGFELCGGGSGGWGATRVRLHPAAGGSSSAT
ncbi:MAG: DNA mismatch repair protein MutS [Puniceicoccaceae bacterium]|nr:MAG: DNA mismatch repair protein MutS [Puniceicoccaceae bacterium]